VRNSAWKLCPGSPVAATILGWMWGLRVAWPEYPKLPNSALYAPLLWGCALSHALHLRATPFPPIPSDPAVSVSVSGLQISLSPAIKLLRAPLARGSVRIGLVIPHATRPRPIVIEAERLSNVIDRCQCCNLQLCG